jgi:hypothetical protein
VGSTPDRLLRAFPCALIEGNGLPAVLLSPIEAADVRLGRLVRSEAGLRDLLAGNGKTPDGASRSPRHVRGPFDRWNTSRAPRCPRPATGADGARFVLRSERNRSVCACERAGSGVWAGCRGVWAGCRGVWAGCRSATGTPVPPAVSSDRDVVSCHGKRQPVLTNHSHRGLRGPAHMGLSSVRGLGFKPTEFLGRMGAQRRPCYARSR